MAPRGRSVTLGIDLVANDKGASKTIANQRTEVAGLGDELQRTANLLGGGFVAYQGFQGLEDAATAASSLTEAQNTANQVFRESDTLVREFAVSAADSYGQSEQAALSYANVFGAILNNMGLTREESADTSVALLKLASDLAAAWDTDVPDALAAIQSGLSGQTESMRRYGVELTQVALKEDARNLGFSTTIENLDRRQRAEVILASIMRQTTDQQGQFNREIEGYNQQQQIANANAENAKAAFGEGLLPIFTNLQQAIGAVAGAYASLPAGVQSATSVIAATGVAVLGVTSAVGLFGPAVKAGTSTIVGLARASRDAALNLVLPRKAIDGLGSSASGADVKVGGLLTRIRQAPLAFGAASTAGVLLAGALFDMAEESKRLDANVDSLISTIESGESPLEAFEAKLAKTFAGIEGGFDLGSWTGDRAFRAVLEGIGLSVDEVSDAITGSKEEWSDFILTLAKNEKIPPEVVKDLTEIRTAFTTATDKTDAYEEAQKALGIEQRKTGDAIDDTTESAKKQGSLFERLNKVLDERKDKVEQQWQAEERMKAATEEVADARADLSEATRAATGDSDEYRDATRAVADAQESLGDAQRGVAEAQERVNEARKAAAERLEDLREKVDELRQSEERANLTTRQAQQAARDALADPRLTALEKEDAQLKAKEAAQAERDLKSERADAARELAEAQARGIEGDKDVIDAKEGVVEAERRVREAARQVADAQKRAAQVIQDAKERVKEASERVEDATLDEAAAWGELNEAQFGATAGVVAHIGALNALLATLAPGSPLALAVEARRNDLLGLATLAAITDAAQSAFNQAGNLPGLFGDAATLYQRGAGVTVNQTFQGTPQQQRRAMADAAGGFFDGLARGAR